MSSVLCVFSTVRWRLKSSPPKAWRAWPTSSTSTAKPSFSSRSSTPISSSSLMCFQLLFVFNRNFSPLTFHSPPHEIRSAVITCASNPMFKAKPFFPSFSVETNLSLFSNNNRLDLRNKQSFTKVISCQVITVALELLLVMEYANGGVLSTRLAEKIRFDEQACVILHLTFPVCASIWVVCLFLIFLLFLSSGGACLLSANSRRSRVLSPQAHYPS